MIRCPFCDHKNAPGADACANCGAKLAAPAEPAPAPPGETTAALPEGETSDFDRSLVALLRQGQKIDAIKRYHRETGLGLAESKNAVEALAKRHGIEMPGSGCGTAVVALAIALGLAVGYAMR